MPLVPIKMDKTTCILLQMRGENYRNIGSRKFLIVGDKKYLRPADKTRGWDGYFQRKTT